jgi:hypothetical protein
MQPEQVYTMLMCFFNCLTKSLQQSIPECIAVASATPWALEKQHPVHKCSKAIYMYIDGIIHVHEYSLV